MMLDISRRLHAVCRAGFILAVLTMAFLLWTVELGGFLVLTVVGGLALGGAFAWANRRRARSYSVPDRFARDAFSTDALNFAHVRVAGVGGLGLVLVAVAVALDFALVAAVLTAGLAGGVIAACAVILYRRRSGPLPSSSTGPGARSVLLTESERRPDATRVERPRQSARQTATASV